MKLQRYGFALRLCEATEGLSDWSSTGVKIECVLGEFPGNTWHVCWTPGEDFPALTEELNERAFLCSIEVGCDESRFLWVAWVNLNFLRVLGGVESLIWQGSTCFWQHVVISGAFELCIFSCHPKGLGNFTEFPVTVI